MAGLLGDGWDDPRSAAIMALAGGLLQKNFAGGLLGANQAYMQGKQALQAGETEKLKRGLLEAQIEETKAQAAERKNKVQLAADAQARQDRFLNGDGGGLPSSAFSPAADGMGPMVPAGSQASQGGLIAQARAMGIPEQAIQADVVFNGGKGISDMLFKRGTPDMQVSNGFAYDKNRQGPGFLPQLNIARDGQASMVQIGPNGLPVVSAPQGALQTYSAYKGAEGAVKPIKVYDPSQQREVFTNETAAATGGNYKTEAGLRNEVTGGMGADPAALRREIAAVQADLKKPLDQASRAALTAHLADLQRQGQAIGAPVAAGPSAAESASNEAAKARAVKQAEVDTVPTSARQNAIANANYLTSVLDQAMKHPGRETATGLSGTLDPRNYLPGTNAKGFRALLDQIQGATFIQAYESLKGAGAITDIEGRKGSDAIARLSTAQSDDEFLGALRDFRQVVQNGLTRAKGSMKANTGASGEFAGDNSDFVKRELLPQLPKTAPKGQRVRDTQTGEVLVFNGVSWVKEK